MVSDIQAKCVESYRRIKNLKLVAEEIGIPWQTVYVHLRAVGEPVTGDKSRYGSDKDRLAARAERIFSQYVPEAVNQNDFEFQAKVDFKVGPYAVDIKSSKWRDNRFCFSLKKQELVADFFVCFAFHDDGRFHVLAVPGELCRFMQSISLSTLTRSRWWDFEIEPEELSDFFKQVQRADEEKAA